MRSRTIGDRVQNSRQSPPTDDNQGENWNTNAEWVLLPAKYIPRILEIVREWNEFDSPE